jgi:hypothetical protein
MLTRLLDNFQYANHIAHYLVIPKPQYPKALTAQPPVSNLILILTNRMLPAIQLDDNFRLIRHKINHELPYRFLTAPFNVLELLGPEEMPKLALDESRVLAQAFSGRGQYFSHKTPPCDR